MYLVCIFEYCFCLWFCCRILAIMLRHAVFCIVIVTLFCSFVSAEKCPKETDFRCHSDKRCIDTSLICNQIFDCIDHSDEENCDCCLDHDERATCQESQFHCSDGKCIDSKHLCNGLKDCSSGEDETNCPPSEIKACRHGQYKCSNGRCIPGFWVCDGTIDCSNDEENCLKTNVTCGSNQFLCLDRRKCIPLSQKCNLNSDCVDGSDEKNCENHRDQNCQTNQFKCSDGKCINKHSLCDGLKDCSSGEDEQKSNCNAVDIFTCHSGQFKCSNNRCIPKSWVCDGTSDCLNDEENCDKSTQKLPNKPSTYNITCASGDFMCMDQQKCIDADQRCNTRIDCPDGSDEADCELNVKKQPTQCNHNEYQCLDGNCIDLTKICDGTKDCYSGEDEHDSNCRKSLTRKCHESDEFLCSNNQCIPESWLCDGVSDCSNDEENCDCTDGDNGSSDCVSKQKNVCSTFKCPVNASCRVLKNVPTCVCSKGFSLNNQTQECEDIDECLEFGICSQGCVNTIGSYECTCIPKFRLSHDNRTCRLIGKTGAILLYAASTSVNWFTLKSKHLKRVAENLNQAIGIGYDGDHIYWTNILVGAESIMKSRMDGSNAMTLFTAGLGKPTDIAVDYITRNIYFTDSDQQHLAVCSNDGIYCKAIITENVHRPRGIVLYPQKGVLFWTDWGANPMIATASMDGTSRVPIITQNIIWPNGLTLDWPNERLYWVDGKFQSIESSKLDGSDRKRVIETASNHPYGIAVFQEKLFWSDWESKSIQSCDKFTGQNVNTVVRDTIIYDLEVFHPAMQPTANNPCYDNQCSHLCLLNLNNSYTCECPLNFELSVNKHKCRPTRKQKTVLMGIGNQMHRLDKRSFGRHKDDKGKTFKFRIDKMALNSATGDVFVADNLKKAIFQVNPKDSITKEIIKDNIGVVSAMTFDDLSNSLYWSDTDRSTIEVYSLDTQNRAVVQNFLGEETPIALVAVPEVDQI